MNKKSEYDRTFIDKLKRLPMIDYVKTVADVNSISYSGNCYSLRCPHPDHDDHNPSFRIWKNADETYSWACMSCHSGKKDLTHKNYGSDIIAFVMWMSDFKGSKHILTFREAIFALAKFYRLELPSYYNTNKKPNRMETLRYIYSENLKKNCKKMREYLYERGLSDDDIQQWKLGSDGTRLYFPLYNQHMNLKGFIWRNFNVEPKYMHTSQEDGFIKSEYLYGIDQIDKSSTTAYITEGTFDVILARKYGLKNVFAVLGKAFGESHAALLKSLGFTKIVVALDGDEAGIGAINNAVNAARKIGFFCSVAILPNNMDLCDYFFRYHENGIKMLSNYIEPVFVYAFKRMAESYLRAKYQAQAASLDSILQYQQTIVDKDEKVLFNNYVNQHFDLNFMEANNAGETQTNMEYFIPEKTTVDLKDKLLCG